MGLTTAPNRALYETVVSHVDLDRERPSGLIARAATELPDGSVQIVDIYESRATLEAFGRERMLPVFEAAGLVR